MLAAGLIERSRSPWSFPVVVVDKKDGSKRFCVDFRRLNKITKPISYPLPLIDDILALLGKAKFFTSLDLKQGYFLVGMDERDKEKNSICVSQRSVSVPRHAFWAESRAEYLCHAYVHCPPRSRGFRLCLPR